MSAESGSVSLELENDRAFQERWWRVERIGWALMALLILAALAGLTGGGGWLSTGTAQSGSAKIDYPRIARWQAADEATITFPASASGPIEVLLPSGFLRVFTVESTTPQPSSVVATADGHLFTFDIARGDGEKSATLSLRASRPTLPDRAQVRIGDGPPADLSFVVLP